MANRYNTTALIEQVKRIPSIPTSQALLSDDDILRFANQQLKLPIVSLIQSVVEEYFVYTANYTVTQVDNFIRIPSEASGLRLREVYYLDSEGGNIRHQAVRVQLEQLGNSYWAFGCDGDNHGAYYLENNMIKFWPEVSSTKYIKIAYYRIPNELVTVASGVTVGDCTIVNGFESTATPPSAWATNLATEYYFDVISPDLPFNTKGTITVNGISANIFYVNDATELALVESGDYIYYKGEAPVAQYVPQEAFYLLAQATACKVLEALGDSQGLKEANADLAMLKQNMLKLVSPRSIGQPKKLVNRNSVFGAARIGWSTIVSR